MTEVDLVNGVPWTQNNANGLFYYTNVELHSSLEKTIKFSHKSVGIFVPSTQVYQPITLEHFTLEGVQTQPTGRRNVLVTVNVPCQFWPPILEGQAVPDEYQARAQEATDNSNNRLNFLRLADVNKDVLIMPAAPVTRPTTKVKKRVRHTRDYTQPLGAFGGQLVSSEHEYLRHGFQLPQMTLQDGQQGYVFNLTLPEQDVQGLAVQLEQFIPWTPQYAPFICTSPESGQLFRFWPPIFPGQQIDSHHRKKCGDRHIELASEPLPAEDMVTFPYPEVRNNVPGHVHEILYPKYSVQVPAGSRMLGLSHRRYKAQNVPALFPPVHIWLEDTPEYRSVVVPNDDQPLNVRVQLNPIPGKPLTTLIQIPRPAELSFRFYPLPLPGQHITDDMLPHEQKIEARNAMRTFQIKLDGTDDDHTLAVHQGRDCTQNSVLQRKQDKFKKPSPAQSNMSRVLNRKNLSTRTQQDTVDFWVPARSPHTGVGNMEAQASGLQSMASRSEAVSSLDVISNGTDSSNRVDNENLGVNHNRTLPRRDIGQHGESSSSNVDGGQSLTSSTLPQNPEPSRKD